MPGLEEHLSGIIPFLWRQSNTRLVLLSVGLILPAFFLNEMLGIQNILVDLLSGGALFLAGRPVFISAVRALWHDHQININVLMTIASIGAFFVGAYTEAGMVMVLFGIGEALESYASARTRNSIQSLIETVPSRATLIRSKGASHLPGILVDVGDLHVGDVIIVKPGEAIPMDGRVVAGETSVNQAVITGESRLVEKASGDEVLAGSINGEGAIEIEVTHLVEDNIASRMLKLVEQTPEKRAHTQRFIDRFAQYYTPAVVMLAMLAVMIPPLFFQQPLFNPSPQAHGWLYRGLALLVVACPCALVISTPVSIISALSNAARHGVLIKGGMVLETLSNIKTIAFDKTGTLTEGKPSVLTVRSAFPLDDHTDHVDITSQEWTPADGLCDDCLVALASTVENRSEHPLAWAVLEESKRRGIGNKFPDVERVTALPGQGVNGQVAGHDVVIGSHNYFEKYISHGEQDCDTAHRDSAKGYTPVMIGVDGNYLGMITIADKIRQSCPEALAMLKDLGIDPLVMLTGDNTQAAWSVGEQLGVTKVMAELLPEDKVNAIETLRHEYGKVAMVGDGINDTPALARADVGIAIGGSLGGTAQAMETADITLMNGSLYQLPFAIKLSHATLRTIKVNVALSLLVKFAFLCLVLVGAGTMWMAVFADTGLSLLVILNGLRLAKRPASL
jgi:Cd2+/Zn2+-exporting ATPase